MKIESKTGRSNHAAERLYRFVSDFRNFNQFIPADKVSDWEAEKESCSFSMDMLGKVRLIIVDKQPGQMIKISSDPDVSQYNFHLWIQMKEVAVEDTRIRITIEPKLNPVMQAMVKSPLKKFVNSMVDEIENFDFPD